MIVVCDSFVVGVGELCWCVWVFMIVYNVVMDWLRVGGCEFSVDWDDEDGDMLDWL